MNEGRTLLTMQPLPPRAGVLDRQQVDTDIREACAVVEARLTDMSQRYGVNGWEIDRDYGSNGFEYGIAQHTIVGRLRLKRPE